MNILRELGDLLYPWPFNCRNCGNSTSGEHPLCRACRNKLGEAEPLRGFGGERFGISAAAHRYDEIARIMVTSLKYSSMSALAEEMAKDMFAAAESAGMSRPDVVTYVPMHAMRRRQKYFDQAELLARLVARQWDMGDSKAIKRIRYSRQQVGSKNAAARRQNVKDAFTAAQSVDGMHVLLIDDVCTTGATSQECARVLIEAGARQVDLLVYALASDDSRMLDDVYM